MVDVATGAVEDREPTPEEQGKDPAAVSLGRKGGLKGGKARAESLSAANEAAGKANERAAQADSRAAEANLKAETERVEWLKLEAKYAPRILSDEQAISLR
jgi:aminoglycoside phosphotransferase